MVISIVAILVALLLPAFKEARETAQHVQCQSHLRQIGIGLVAYANDNDGSKWWNPNTNGDYSYNQFHSDDDGTPNDYYKNLIERYVSPSAVYGDPLSEFDWKDFWPWRAGGRNRWNWPSYAIYAGPGSGGDTDGPYGNRNKEWHEVFGRRIDDFPGRPIAGDVLFWSEGWGGGTHAFRSPHWKGRHFCKHGGNYRPEHTFAGMGVSGRPGLNYVYPDGSVQSTTDNFWILDRRARPLEMAEGVRNIGRAFWSVRDER